MVETYFSMRSTSVAQHGSQQSRPASPAQPDTKLQTLLSLTAFVGSLSCPVSSEYGRHAANVSVEKAEDEQHEQGHEEASPAASEYASEAQAQVQNPGVGQSTWGQPAQEGEMQGSTGSQQSSSPDDVQQVSSTSAKQCQAICLQVTLPRTTLCLIALQPHTVCTNSISSSAWLWQRVLITSQSALARFG